jgi:hypothetical protein
VLLGQNSSGKSTLIRSFPLLKQGLGVRGQGPFLWLGQLVDFGSFDEALSTHADSQSLCIEFEFEHSIVPNNPYRARNYKQEQIKLSISELRIEGSRSSCFQYEITIDKDVISFQILSDKFISFSVNGIDYLRFVKDRVEVKQWLGALPSLGIIISETQPSQNSSASFPKEIGSTLRQLCHGKTETDRLTQLMRVLTNTPPQNLLSTLKSTSYGDTQWKKNTANWTEESSGFKSLRALTIGANIVSTLSSISEYMTGVLYNTRYIKPLRASAERYYRKQGLAVDEIDPEGDNFPLFLHSMNPAERASFQEWSVRYFGIWIEVKESAGHLSLLLNSNEESANHFNMADAGFGYSQMFPILAQLWAIRRPQLFKTRARKVNFPFIFSIEQPELHLHPRLQAKLADVFVNAISAARELEIDLRLIIETHSEYLVNRLGYLIARRELDNLDVSITVFEKEKPSASTTIRRATFSDKGSLQNWPFGFFEPEVGIIS